MELIELEKFKKQNKIDFIDWNKPAIKTHGLWYKLKNIRIGNTNYPYVCVPKNVQKPKQLSFRNFKLPENVLNKIQKINENKSNLKGVSYLINNNEYFVTGIGDKSIRAFKNDNDREQYFWYYTKEGNNLLNYLYGKIEQSIL